MYRKVIQLYMHINTNININTDMYIKYPALMVHGAMNSLCESVMCQAQEVIRRQPDQDHHSAVRLSQYNEHHVGASVPRMWKRSNTYAWFIEWTFAVSPLWTYDDTYTCMFTPFSWGWKYKIGITMSITMKMRTFLQSGSPLSSQRAIPNFKKQLSTVPTVG